MTRDKKLLLAERSKECRLMDKTSKGDMRSWLYVDWQKGENLYGLGPNKEISANLRGAARYLSHESAGDSEFPFLLSDKGYGILIASDGPTFCCDISSYGSYLYTENVMMMDYYFITGKRSAAILSAYAYLSGKL